MRARRKRDHAPGMYRIAYQVPSSQPSGVAVSVPVALLNYPGISNAAIVTWARLAQYSRMQLNPARIAGYQGIADLLLCSVPTARGAIDELIRAGFVEAHNESGVGERPDLFVLTGGDKKTNTQGRMAQKIRGCE